jgi:hypothetical protein
VYHYLSEKFLFSLLLDLTFDASGLHSRSFLPSIARVHTVNYKVGGQSARRVRPQKISRPMAILNWQPNMSSASPPIESLAHVTMMDLRSPILMRPSAAGFVDFGSRKRSSRCDPYLLQDYIMPADHLLIHANFLSEKYKKMHRYPRCNGPTRRAPAFLLLCQSWQRNANRCIHSQHRTHFFGLRKLFRSAAVTSCLHGCPETRDQA